MEDGGDVLPDPGRGKRVKGARYVVEGKGVCKYNGHQMIGVGPNRKSKYKSVSWDTRKLRWSGRFFDESERRPSNGAMPKELRTRYFDDEEECYTALVKLQKEIDTKNERLLHEMAQKLDHTRDLPLRPKKAEDAKPNTAYYTAARFVSKGATIKEFRPIRHVLSGSIFQMCCQYGIGHEKACTQVAVGTTSDVDAVWCKAHGGGLRVGEGNCWRCSYCKSVELDAKRKVQNGGNGLCGGCEAHLQAEAAAAGVDAPPAPTERWEDVVFRKLLPLVTYADGTPFPPDQRDERRGGGLGTSKAVKRRRECDTTTNRFPDGLWILRDTRGCALLAVIGEVDEHSHSDRDPACESGKIDDTFQALQDRLAKEGAATGAGARHDARMIPIVFIKVNPNAYDARRVGLDERVATVAALVNTYAHKTEDELEDLQTTAPIVHVLYYHSKEGAANLAHFAAKAPAAGWAYTVH